MENGAACLTVRENVTEWLIEPLVPVTVIVDVASGVFIAAPNWNAAPWGDPVTEIDSGAGDIVVTPAGSPDTVRLIVPVKKFTGFACTTWN
jgi:hypothetical protein